MRDGVHSGLTENYFTKVATNNHRVWFHVFQLKFQR